ncbi:MAG: response regulator [Aquabacterium sp.]|jgi:two-component system, OmpR family, response regulator TctD|uniref:response regulator n=1 Tax=Aquabacterium sp. TaxID=1872578 RepID=UPI003BB1A5E4
MRLLLVEDQEELSEWLARALRQGGHAIDVMGRGDHADHALLTQPYDLVILDLSLPGLDGLEVLRRLRGRGNGVPVLVLTARGSTEERVIGLNLGADDYLAKPFELSELEARVKALLRRGSGRAPTVRVGQLEIDTSSRLVTLDGRPLALTPRELAVLEALVARLGRPVARELLFEKVFDMDADARPEAIESYVSRLRKKLEGSGATITTLRGLGYLLSEAA